MSDNFESACKSVVASLGYSNLKNEQYAVIKSFVLGSDVFGVLPTGYGKTLCYACLPGIFDELSGNQSSIVVVISPLTAIMKDQVTTLSEKGLPSAYVTAEQKNEEVLKGIRDGIYKLVFFTPEMLLLNKCWRQLLMTQVYSENLRAVIVDEAHTIKKWGDTFRKTLLRIGEVRSLVSSSVHMMALTATANKTLRNQVISVLGMKSPKVVAVSPAKFNLMYIIKRYDNIQDAFATILKGIQEQRTKFPRTIIYCQRLHECGRLYQYFRSLLGGSFTEPIGAPDLPQFRLLDMYHSSVDEEIKENILQLFSKPSHLRIVIATVAFGMGINCQDVRQIVHVGPPEDVESYIQETGRAGRDGLQSIAVIFIIKEVRVVHTDMHMRTYINNKTMCRRRTLFHDFEGYVHDITNLCMCCDICKVDCQCSYCDLKVQSFCV